MPLRQQYYLLWVVLSWNTYNESQYQQQLLAVEQQRQRKS